MNPVVLDPQPEAPETGPDDRPTWWEPGYDDQTDEPPPEQDDSP